MGADGAWLCGSRAPRLPQDTQRQHFGVSRRHPHDGSIREIAVAAQRLPADLYPGQVLATNRHLEVFAELARGIAGGELRKLMVALPPRSLKSFIFSACLPAYLLGKNPGLRILCVSYGMDLARQHSADCRKIMMSEWYQKTFPQTKLSGAKSTEILFETTANGCRRAVSAEGSVTGLGGDVIIADDLVSANDAHNGKVHQESNGLVFSLSAHAPQ
jgi:hypothetical protein